MARTYYITNSTSRHRLLLKILQVTQTQITAVSLLQLMVIGDSHSAPMNTVLSVSQVSGHARHKQNYRLVYSDGRGDMSALIGFSLCILLISYSNAEGIDVPAKSLQRFQYSTLLLLSSVWSLILLQSLMPSSECSLSHFLVLTPRPMCIA